MHHKHTGRFSRVNSALISYRWITCKLPACMACPLRRLLRGGSHPQGADVGGGWGRHRGGGRHCGRRRGCGGLPRRPGCATRPARPDVAPRPGVRHTGVLRVRSSQWGRVDRCVKACRGPISCRGDITFKYPPTSVTARLPPPFPRQTKLARLQEMLGRHAGNKGMRSQIEAQMRGVQVSAQAGCGDPEGRHAVRCGGWFRAEGCICWDACAVLGLRGQAGAAW